MTKCKKLIIINLLLVILGVSFAIALPPNDFEPWRMYAVYETGYDAGKNISGNVSSLQYCMENADYFSWASTGWDNQSIRKAEKLFLYGCVKAKDKKMTKQEFMKNMFKSMME